MMTQSTSFRRKLIVGAILCLLGWFLMTPSVSFGAVGNHLSQDEIISYDGDGSMWIEFEAETSFNASCILSGGKCSCGAYFLVSPDWQGVSKVSRILEDLNLFSDESCVHDQNFTAGNTYKVYLIDDNNLPIAGDTETEIRAGKIRDLDNEPLIDEESLFTIESYYDAQWWQETGHTLSFPPSITINVPADSSEVVSGFTMEIDYSDANGFQKLMILFEDWHASSTCPIYGTAQWTEEYQKWFNYQSLPYFSPSFTTSTGTTTIPVSDLATGIYNCVRCYFINETTGAISDELCPAYDISVLVYIPPEEIPTYFLEIADWLTYYTEHSEKFATPTPLFTTMAGVFEPLISWIGSTALGFQSYFDPDVAKEKGVEMGSAIPIARGYLENIDDFFGGLPISGIFLFYIITALVVFVYRLVKGILTLVVPSGL